VVAAAVREGRTTIARVLAVLELSATSRAAGGDRLRRILDGGVSYSSPERELMRLLREAGLHGFVANLPFRGPSGRHWKIDAGREDICLALEVDSKRWQGGPDRHQAEIDKFNDIQDAGWYLVRITPEDIRKRPAALVQRVRDAIARLRREVS